MKRLFYAADVLGNNTTTFLKNDIERLKNKLELVVFCCNSKSEQPITHKIYCESYRPNKFLEKVLWKFRSYNILYNNFNYSFSNRLTTILKCQTPDALHCNFGDFAIRIWDNLNAKYRESIPFYIQLHGYDASRLLFSSKIYRERLKKVLTRKNVRTIVVSQNMLNTLNQQGIYPSNCRVIYCGIDLRLFRPNRKETTREKTFLQISSFREKKGHIFTIKAFAKFLSSRKDKENYKLVLAGGGILLAEMKRLVKDLKIDPYVAFPGWVTPKQAVTLLNQANYFVHHSIEADDGDREGIPNALMEAMAMELPIISTYHSGIPELVQDCINGYLVEEKDVAAYAKRMEDILYWGYLTENRIRVKEHFEINEHINALMSYYQEASI